MNLRQWWWAGAVAATGVLLAVVVAEHGLELGNQAASILALLVSVAGLGRETARGAADEASVHGRAEHLDRAARDLAEAVGEQWRAESRLRRLQDPEPLPVHWTPAEPHLSDHWANVTAGAADPPDRSSALQGHLGQVARTYARVPSRRLVVLGEPGAGKTVLLLQLALDLLAGRGPDDPVPVVFGLGTWDPRARSLSDWLEERLIEGYPATAARDPAGVTRARRLLELGRVLPLLDGLDELPAPLRPHAVQALNRDLGRGDPLVLTCRTRDYADTVATADVITSAAVIELRPLSWETVGAYLTRTAPPRPGRTAETAWAPVLREVEQDPRDAVCRTLRTVLGSPLMVGLARAVHSEASSDPRTLLERRFADPAVLEAHLLDGFVPAAYGDLPDAPEAHGPDGTIARLAFLAHHMQRRGTRDLAWWELPPGTPRGLGTLTRILLILPVALLASYLVAPGAGGGLLCLEAAAFVAGMGGTHRLLSYVTAPGAVRDRRRLMPRVLACGAVLVALGALTGAFRPLTYESGESGYWDPQTHPTNLVLQLALLGVASATLVRAMGISYIPTALSRAFRASPRTTAAQLRRLLRIVPVALAAGLTAGLVTGAVFGAAQAAVTVTRASAHHGLPATGTHHVAPDRSRYTRTPDGWRYGQRPDGTRYVEIPRPAWGALTRDGHGVPRLWDGTRLRGGVERWERLLRTEAVDCPRPSSRCTRYAGRIRLLLFSKGFRDGRVTHVAGTGVRESPAVEWYLSLPAVREAGGPVPADPDASPGELAPTPVRFAPGGPVQEWQERAPRRVLAAHAVNNSVCGQLTVGLVVGLAAGLRRWLSAPADVTRASSPAGSLHGDRRAALIRSLVVAALTAVFLIWHIWRYGGVQSGYVPLAFGLFDRGVAFAMALPAGPICLYVTAWGRYMTARAWLAATGRLPWRLMGFLAEAHARGVLRQVGAVYQFRHARLQERLAAGGTVRDIPGARDGRTGDRRPSTVG
ncbi:NACHT domain-containing protein [Streptomyces sp. HU2014]|uniref:NACHT domain-containing protein n=1 Tax=Streptomyces sp. HU2014 TaxID=2939414 RepID=UPI00200E4A1F|nr:NACHT domain-containing protein [Streptomyces sp. HU2014]UQI45289.1 NACHT domain-containing protein [Streptomyces sp. HU2014]